jgi:hypothetical protein
MKAYQYQRLVKDFSWLKEVLGMVERMARPAVKLRTIKVGSPINGLLLRRKGEARIWSAQLGSHYETAFFAVYGSGEKVAKLEGVYDWQTPGHEPDEWRDAPIIGVQLAQLGRQQGNFYPDAVVEVEIVDDQDDCYYAVVVHKRRK